MRKLKKATALASAMALVLATAGSALAANPASASTSTGQSLLIEITSPANGAVTNVPPGTVTAQGTAAIGPLMDSGNVLYVMDLSGSTLENSGMDCNGDGAVNGMDDLNGDSRVGSILDCEISGVLALNSSLAGSPGAEVGMVVFGNSAFTADVDPTAGDQIFTSPLAVDNDSNGRPDIEDVARSVRAGLVNRFTYKNVGQQTHFDNALTAIRGAFASKAGEENFAFFVSDGVPTYTAWFTTGSSSPLALVAAAGIRVNTYSVGSLGAGCAATSPLRIIATTTGGTCIEVADPTDLSSALTQAVTIDHVEVSLNGGAPAMASLLGSDWSIPLAGLVSGPNLIEATVVASDGTRATADVTVYGNGAPAAEAGGPYAVHEGDAITLSGSGYDPDGDGLTFHWSPGSGLDDASVASPSFHGVDDGTETLTLTVTDPYGMSGSDSAQVTVLNVAPTVGPVSAPLDPQMAGTPVTASAAFTDPGVLDTHTVLIDWGDGSSSAGTVTGGGGSGTAAGTHTYAAAGIYTISMTVTDDDGGAGSSIFQYVVVYDPDGGFVTGGGWFDSPAGAYTPDPAAAGRANFGFVSKYQKGASVPTGQTQFQFKAGDLSFHSGSYDWLVIAGARAQYKGVGTINGAGEYGFLLTAIDGRQPGGGGVDRIRIKIWDRTTGSVLYDNQMGDSDDAWANTALGEGRITIHK